MPKTSAQQKEEKLIADINEIVLNALRVLINAGKPLDGLKDLAALFVQAPHASVSDLHATFIKTASKVHAAKEIVKGVMTDDDGKGYKDVTMRAFLNGLQSIFKDLYLASKLLEADFNFDENLQKQLSVIDHREYVLRTLGLNSDQIKTINNKIKAARRPDIAQLIRDHIQDLDKADRTQRIKFMIIGASCYLPFASLEDGDAVDMPVENLAGNFELKAFQNEKINMCLGVSNPYFAHLLTPKDPNDLSGQSKLLCMGTNPMPTTKALFVTLQADAGAGSVGELLINSSKILFDKVIKEQYKANLKKRMAQAKNDNADSMQEIRRGASIEVNGQSLGGALCLHLGANYSFMVRMGAFEPALLMPEKEAEIENTLNNAHAHFCQIVDEIEQENADLKEICLALKADFPKDKEVLRAELVEDNLAIMQFSDIVPQYGTVAPPATFYHVVHEEEAEKEKLPSSFELVTKLTPAPHAAVFAATKGVIIKKLTPAELAERLASPQRAEFTDKMRSGLNILDNILKAVDKEPSTKHTPKKRTSARKTPHHIEEIKIILKDKIEKKLSLILESLKTIDSPHSWKRGNHLNEKIKELDAHIERAMGLSLLYNISPIVTRAIDPLKANNPSAQLRRYLDLFEIGIGSSSVLQTDFQKAILDNINILFENEDIFDLRKQNAIELMELYELLDKDHQERFLEKVLKTVELKPLHHDFCMQLCYRTFSKKQRDKISDLINEKPMDNAKIQEKAKVIVFSNIRSDRKAKQGAKEAPIIVAAKKNRKTYSKS